MRMRIYFALALAALVSACAGGGGNPSAPTPPVVNTPPPPANPVINGTPWSQLPSLSVEAKSFIVDYNLASVYNGSSVGQVKRWDASSPILVAAEAFRPQDLIDAVALWRTATNGKVTFEVVPELRMAKVPLDFVWPPPGNYPVSDAACGVEGPDVVQNNVIVSGFGHYAFKVKPECAGNGEHKIGLAHGLGHILGLGGHTPSGSDLMGSPNSTWSMSPLLVEIINWLYSVPPGTRPI